MWRALRFARAKLICATQSFHRQKDDASKAFAPAAIARCSTRRKYSDWRDKDRREKRRPEIRGHARAPSLCRRALIERAKESLTRQTRFADLADDVENELVRFLDARGRFAFDDKIDIRESGA